MNKTSREVISIFLTAFTVRCVAVFVTTLTSLNPDSRADAVGFSRTAKSIAHGMIEVQPFMIITGQIGIYELWGTFLAPFWLLPGPSGFYARLANAFLAAVAIYNIYVLARYYHSHHAGIIAVLPMIFYPSFVAVHSTLLREALVLFGVTTAARLFVFPIEKKKKVLSYGVASIVLYGAYLQRPENAIIYTAAIGSALFVHAIESGYLSKRAIGTGILGFPIGTVIAYPFIREGVGFLARTRQFRAAGRAVYLPEVIPNTVAELVAFSWIGATYFLYAPFPWMVQTIPDIIVSIEGVINIGFTIAAIWGIRSIESKNTPAVIGLLVGLIISLVLYGVGTANYGTGMRHRQMFVWIIYIFGAIGITKYVRIK